jgi:hypothetical protein
MPTLLTQVPQLLDLTVLVTASTQPFIAVDQILDASYTFTQKLELLLVV